MLVHKAAGMLAPRAAGKLVPRAAGMLVPDTNDLFGGEKTSSNQIKHI